MSLITRLNRSGLLEIPTACSEADRPEQEQRRVNVDFPIWMIHSLDKEAKRLGVPRQSIIKVWVAERLEKKKA